MFKIKNIRISGFWERHRVESEFADGVNIIIGSNGTGKTTFMNILYSVLSVDPDGLYENEFSEVKINLVDGGKVKTVRAVKAETEVSPFPLVTYYISNQKYVIPLVTNDEARAYPLSHRRRALEESAKLRGVLAQFVMLASLSVYRFRNDPEVDPRERSRRALSPVDSRLQELKQRLTHYQLELSDEARNISADLQKEVLTSLLYNPENGGGYTIRSQFNEQTEKSNLISAYRQLGLNGPEVATKIQKHVAAVGAALQVLKSQDKGAQAIDIAALQARASTARVIELSLAAEKRLEGIFSQINKFLEIVASFIEQKSFAFSGGELTVKASSNIALQKLSSGEKQLLILLIEALLQRQQPYIFLADEPELSLHISWQRRIISAITKLNPNAQVIVATHSPEIAGKFSRQIIDMAEILHV